MHSDQPNLATPLKLACAWMLILDVLGLLFASAFLHYRLFGIALILGWLPILMVALRRPQTPTISDIVLMFAGFPAVVAAFAILTRWYS